MVKGDEVVRMGGMDDKACQDQRDHFHLQREKANVNAEWVKKIMYSVSVSV